MKKVGLGLVSICWLLAALFPSAAAADVSAARVLLVEGDVFLQRADEVDWRLASPNDPVGEGDRLWTGPSGRAEMAGGGDILIRLDHQTQVEVTGDLSRHAFRLLSGSIYLNHPDIWRDGEEVEFDTGVAVVRSRDATILRVDAYEDGVIEVRVYKGQADLSTDLERLEIRTGRLTEVTAGGEIRSAERIALSSRDDFDDWNDDVELQLARGGVAPGDQTVDYSSLDNYGEWVVEPTYGRVWRPVVVTAGWRPYYYGRWLWVRPNGWTWVAAEPWGYLPHHYGQWVLSTSYGWVWIPGARWAPAWVIWAPYGAGWAWAPCGPFGFNLFVSAYSNYWVWTLHVGAAHWHDHHGVDRTPAPRRINAGGKESDVNAHPPRPRHPQQGDRDDTVRRIPTPPGQPKELITQRSMRREERASRPSETSRPDLRRRIAVEKRPGISNSRDDGARVRRAAERPTVSRLGRVERAESRADVDLREERVARRSDEIVRPTTTESRPAVDARSRRSTEWPVVSSNRIRRAPAEPSAPAMTKRPVTRRPPPQSLQNADTPPAISRSVQRGPTTKVAPGASRSQRSGSAREIRPESQKSDRPTGPSLSDPDSMPRFRAIR